MLVDSHAHLNFKDYSSDFDEVMARAKEVGVEKIVNIGTSLGDSEQVIALAQRYNFIHATVGIHPNDDPNATLENIDWEKFEELARSPKVVAIGECGLDYSKISKNDMYVAVSDRTTQPTSPEHERQRKLFLKQIEIAEKLNLPLSIHIRDSQEDLVEIAGSSMNQCIKLRGVFHCFSGDEKYLDFILTKLPNFYISFAGNVTFKNASRLQDLAKMVPLNRLFVETDCPFLAPQPHRGQRNEPSNVKITAERLAEIKGIPFEKIAKITTENAERLFGV